MDRKTITIDIDRDYDEVVALTFIGHNPKHMNVYHTAVDLTGSARHFSLRHGENGMVIKKYGIDGSEVDE